MAKRTQIVCMHEGKEGRSIDPVFVNAFLKAYNPHWLHPSTTQKALATGKVRFIPCGSKSELQKKIPQELRNCIAAGSDTTLIVFTDVDDGLRDGKQLRDKYWEKAQENGVTKDMFDKVVFICPKDRIENWIEFLHTGTTNEDVEGPRVKDNSIVKDMARLLAAQCHQSQQTGKAFPPSLEWSCRNWKALVERMQ